MRRPDKNKSIPLVDLKAQYSAHKDEFNAALRDCVDNTRFIGGPDVDVFAEEFSEYCGGGHTALCGNGTDALELALVELLGPGDGRGEVVTVANTFIATTEAISNSGYTPVFVDVDPDTHLMNLDRLEETFSNRTRAILPVHLYGQMPDMERLMQIADRHGVAVIEDAAQAHGSAWKGRRPGQWGHVACFSFYPGKNLGAWGDGGAVFTRDQELARRIRMRANHGREAKYRHEFEGVNSRLDSIQAAILRVKLRHLPEWTLRRQEIASWYDTLLADVDAVRTPVKHEDGEHVYHLYVVRVEDRDDVLETLKLRGIGAGVHYPIPLHKQPAYRGRREADVDLPFTEAAADEVLSLPLYPELAREDVERVVGTLTAVVSSRQGVV